MRKKQPTSGSTTMAVNFYNALQGQNQGVMSLILICLIYWAGSNPPTNAHAVVLTTCTSTPCTLVQNGADPRSRKQIVSTTQDLDVTQTVSTWK